EHIMRWPSPWGEGFPGWHLECTCMSHKYLGDTFDIHGGGMDLKFPHHECEIAQAKGAYDRAPVRYWMHTNMLTVNGQKMSKSLGNSFLPAELITGNHPLLDQAYSPMTVRFFMLQSQYRSTLDFSNDALKAAQKGYKKIANGLRIIKKLEYPSGISANPDAAQEKEINDAIQGCYDGMNDDLNTAVAIAHLFTLLKKINSIYTGSLSFESLSVETFSNLKRSYISLLEDVLGIKEEVPAEMNGLTDELLQLYKGFKESRQYDKVDEIRGAFKSAGLLIKDMKNSIDWGYEE
ncbi:MAG: Cysteine--tRNA ligase, partial [Bacteroidota bacterium]